MNKPKSTTIELTVSDVLNSIEAVAFGHIERAAVPGKYKIWKEGGEDGKIYLEVFHND